MTKPISRKMAVDALLYRMQTHGVADMSGSELVIILPCPECDEPILPDQAIQFDHIHGHAMGGAHEYKNLRPIHAECHKKKSKRDVAALAKINRITGVTGNGPRKKIPTRQMSKAPHGFKYSWATGRMERTE